VVVRGNAPRASRLWSALAVVAIALLFAVTVAHTSASIAAHATFAEIASEVR
jgi:hypothetical protein